MFGYIAASPRLFIQYFEISPQHYGFLFGMNALSLILGSQISARLLKSHRPDKLLPWALRAMMTAGLCAFMLTLAGLITLPLLMLCMVSFMFCQGFVGPNSAAMALSDQGHRLGSASAMLGTFTISCGALAGFLVSLASSTSPMPLALILGVCTTLAWAIGHLARRP
jgi:DHA1 family bicyclomycin/chloramphenicol resistance-like MFS transporter